MIDAGELLANHEKKRLEMQAIGRHEQGRAAIAAARSGTSMTIRQWDVYFAVRDLLLTAPEVRVRTESAHWGRAVAVIMHLDGHPERELRVELGRAELGDPELLQREVLSRVGRLWRIADEQKAVDWFVARRGGCLPPRPRSV